MPKKNKTNLSAGKSPLIIIVAASLIAGLAVGYALGIKNKTVSVGGLCLASTTQEIKEKLLQAGAIKEYANFLSGKILSVQSNEVSFETALVNPLQDEILKIRTAVITDQTKIYILSLRSMEERQRATKESAEQIKELQEELIRVEADIKACSSPENISALSCQDKDKVRPAIIGELSRLRSLSGDQLRIEGKPADLKPGQLITVMAGKAQKASLGSGQMDAGVNIANEQKFEVTAIEAKGVLEKGIEKKP